MKGMKRIVSIMLVAVLTLCSGVTAVFAQNEDSNLWEQKKNAIREVEKEDPFTEDEENQLSQIRQNMMVSTLAVGDTIIEEVEYNDEPEVADYIYNDCTVVGDTYESWYDVDYFEFVLTERSVVTISCLSLYRPGLLFGVCDRNGDPIVGCIDTGLVDGYYGDGLIYNFEPGTYYICVLDEFTDDYEDGLEYLFYYTAVAAGDSPFIDVLPGVYYYEPVLWAVENGITAGTSEITFSPDDSCTRGQVVTFLYRTYGENAVSTVKNPFIDVYAGAYFEKPVLWALENKVTSGISATSFGPDDFCTRGQVVTFLWRANGSPEPKSMENPFYDTSADAYYYKAILWAVENGITSGVEVGQFAPEATCTRGQVVTFLQRAVNNIPR